MKLIYCSCVCSEDTYKKLFNESKNMPGQQVQKYNRIMLEGLAQQENVMVEAISKLPLSLSNTKKRFVKIEDELWKSTTIHYLPYVNIPKISNLLQMVCAAVAILRLNKKELPAVILDVLNISMGLGIAWACKVKKIPLIGIVTDLPEYLVGNKELAFVRQCKSIMERCDGYVLLTEAMNNIVNPKREKPYVVIEGQVDAAMGQHENLLKNKYEKKVCMYSGSLDVCNGITYLVEGFLQADIEDAELHIFGAGDYVPELKKISEEKENVKYFGMRLNSEVVEAQTRATLLINPRSTNQEFTKYSFPSKNMEYMASGTPILTTKLPGMPKEYCQYVFVLENETTKGMENALCDILGQSKSTLHEKGIRAKEFVLNNKTGYIQSKKIVELVQEIIY